LPFEVTLPKGEEMKRFCLFVAAALVLTLLMPQVSGAAKGTWFDLENCSMCKNMTAEEGLMEHMHWENFVIKDGWLTVTRVDPGFEEAFGRSMKNMEKTGQKLMSGEQMYLCGFCQSYGGLHMAGASFQTLETDVGYIDLVTSTDPEIIKKIHAHAERTIDEYKKMEAAEVHHKGHEHH
jgi:hypothetical protein